MERLLNRNGREVMDIIRPTDARVDDLTAAMVEEYGGVVQFAGPQGLGNPDGRADSRTTKLCDLHGKK
jgi:hypothetical protein